MEDRMFYINFMDNLINLQIMTRTEKRESESIEYVTLKQIQIFAALNTEWLFLEDELNREIEILDGWPL